MIFLKVNIAITVDVDLLKKFSDALKQTQDYPDDVIEDFMRQYITASHAEKVDAADSYEEPYLEPVDDNDYVALTENFLTKCKKYAVGQLANIVLRQLLEAGVASEEEVAEMQKASGKVSIKKYHIAYGIYCKDNFKTAFPLLIAADRKKLYDVPQKFLVMPLTVYGQKYNLSAQWFVQNRELLENWIRSHLPEWFKHATEDQKADMRKFIAKT